MSFRSKVLDALDIHKKTIKLQCNETFPKIYSEDGNLTELTAVDAGGYTRSNHVNYAVSKQIKNSNIGPNVGGGATVKQTLDVLGFLVGDPVVNSAYKNMYPITMPTNMSTTTASGYTTLDDAYTGFHTLGGLYDPVSTELRTMRKSAITPFNSETLFGNGNDGGANDHSHTDWPDNTLDQMRMLIENPYADSLYYHSTRLSFLLTGITIPDSSEKASNHRGVVRMLILRPRIPTAKMRWSGVSGQPMINMDYPPHFDTDLFYTKTKTLGGRMDTSVLTRQAEDASVDQHNARKSHLTPSFGLNKYAAVDPVINQKTTVQSGVANSQLHYGHPIPTEGTTHTLSSYDVLTAPINRDKYAVVVDKMVTLDTLHHGVASKRIENVVIPYNKKVKFPGRKTTDTVLSGGLSHKLDADVETEPINFQSRPIIMFLSMDQKISAQVTGYTTISEC